MPSLNILWKSCLAQPKIMLVASHKSTFTRLFPCCLLCKYKKIPVTPPVVVSSICKYNKVEYWKTSKEDHTGQHGLIPSLSSKINRWENDDYCQNHQQYRSEDSLVRVRQWRQEMGPNEDSCRFWLKLEGKETYGAVGAMGIDSLMRVT